MSLLAIVQRSLGAVVAPLIVDGKPLAISNFTADPDAAVGWGAGGHAPGYKLHVLVDALQRLLTFEVHPMNQAECTCAQALVSRAAALALIPQGATLIGDASYDSNPLYHAAATAGARLIAPRRRPELRLCRLRQHHPDRLAAIQFTEHDPAWEDMRKRVRTTVERYFGTLATFGGGLFGLPAWVRRLHRVRIWVSAKVVLNAARQAMKRAFAA